MKRFIFAVWSFTLLVAATARADDADDTLRFYLSKAKLVVIGTIASEPSSFVYESGVPNYICDFKVREVLKGDAKLKGETLNVDIVRFEGHPEDKNPLIAKDKQCILFLRNASPPAWETVDVWFGAQQASPWMARSLKRLADEK